MHGDAVDDTLVTPQHPHYHDLAAEDSPLHSGDHESLDMPDMETLTTEQRRRRADAILGMLQQDSLHRRLEWAAIKFKMEAMENVRVGGALPCDQDSRKRPLY